jgi:hypothetical protein
MFGLFSKEHFSLLLLLLRLLHLLLDILHKFHLLCYSLAPEVFSLAMFGLPVGQFSLEIFDVVRVCVVDSDVVLFLFLQESGLAFGSELAHPIVTEFVSKVNYGNGVFVCVISSKFHLELFNHEFLMLEVVVSHLNVEVELLKLSVVFFKFCLSRGDFSDFEENFLYLVRVEGRQQFGLSLIKTGLQKIRFFLHEKMSFDDLLFFFLSLLDCPSTFGLQQP